MPMSVSEHFLWWLLFKYKNASTKVAKWLCRRSKASEGRWYRLKLFHCNEDSSTAKASLKYAEVKCTMAFVFYSIIIIIIILLPTEILQTPSVWTQSVYKKACVDRKGEHLSASDNPTSTAFKRVPAFVVPLRNISECHHFSCFVTFTPTRKTLAVLDHWCSKVRMCLGMQLTHLEWQYYACSTCLLLTRQNQIW